MTEEARLRIELERAYRALRGFWTFACKEEVPDRSMLAYHSMTIGAACRFVDEGDIAGSNFFEGKPVAILHDALSMRKMTTP